MNNRIKGNHGENQACEFLTGQGFKIIARNFACRSGEIDIVAMKDNALHFIEVKSRTGDLIAGRFAVNAEKQRHIKSTANYFMKIHGFANKYFVSFDVVEITAGKCEFLENCFY